MLDSYPCNSECSRNIFAQLQSKTEQTKKAPEAHNFSLVLIMREVQKYQHKLLPNIFCFLLMQLFLLSTLRRAAEHAQYIEHQDLFA